MMKEGARVMKNEAAVQLGQLGGQATAKRHGKEHYSRAGKQGAAKRWGKRKEKDERDQI